MLKKISHIAISILLLIATTGFTSFRHYCDEELISNSIMSDQSGCCDKSPTCCHDEAQSYQVEEEFFLLFYDYDFGQFPVILSVFYGFSENPLSQTTNPMTSFEGVPLPDPKKAPSYLQVFIL